MADNVYGGYYVSRQRRVSHGGCHCRWSRPPSPNRFLASSITARLRRNRGNDTGRGSEVRHRSSSTGNGIDRSVCDRPGIPFGPRDGIDCRLWSACVRDRRHSSHSACDSPLAANQSQSRSGLGTSPLSGSLVVAGNARIQAERIADNFYAQRLAAQARKFTLARSELRDGIDRILAYVTWLLVPDCGAPDHHATSGYTGRMA